MTLLAACLISVVIASFSNAIALLVRQQEALIGISQFIVLPLQFLSSAIMDTTGRARAGCGTWRATTRSTGPARRRARRLSADPDWARCCPGWGCWPRLAVVMGWLATRAFRTYQRSA